jgi:copper oxidase (laccase) domain-containing protein
MTSLHFADAVREGRLSIETHGPIRCVTYPVLSRCRELSAMTTLRNDTWPATTTGPQLLKVAGLWVSHVFGIPVHGLIAGKQVHGTNIFSFSKDHPAVPPVLEPQVIPSTDGFLTNARRMALIVVTADCLPIFLYDPRRAVVGLLHCGRAGTMDDTVGVGVGIERMREDFGSNPADCVAVIGPSVGPCCYDTDLWGANERRLRELGVASVFNCRVCTKCNNDVFYSYRAERENAGRMISAIALK